MSGANVGSAAASGKLDTLGLSSVASNKSFKVAKRAGCEIAEESGEKNKGRREPHSLHPSSVLTLVNLRKNTHTAVTQSTCSD